MTSVDKSEEWQDDAMRAWMVAELSRCGLRLTGPIERPHPPSTVLRAPTERGDVFCKAPAPGLEHEAALTAALARWQPEHIIPLLAVHPERGWMLMGDAGTRLREVIRADRDLGHWDRVLPAYANLQLAMVPHLAELLALGADDRQLDVLPERFAALLEQEHELRVGQPDGVTAEQLRRLRALIPVVRAQCAALAEYGIPETLDQADLHDGNISLRDGRYRLLDWSECAITHPFFSLRTVAVSVEISFGLEEGEAPLTRLRDAYLAPWTRVAPRQTLLDAFALAQRLWMIPTALRYQRYLRHAGKAECERVAHAIPSLLMELLDATEDQTARGE